MERPGPTLVTVRVGGLPAPAVGAHGREIPAGVPAQLTLGLGRVCPALGDVAGAPWLDAIGQGRPLAAPNAATICSTLWPWPVPRL